MWPTPMETNRCRFAAKTRTTFLRGFCRIQVSLDHVDGYSVTVYFPHLEVDDDKRERFW